MQDTYAAIYEEAAHTHTHTRTHKALSPFVRPSVRLSPSELRLNVTEKSNKDFSLNLAQRY